MNQKTTIVIVTSILLALAAYASISKTQEAEIPVIQGMFAKWTMKHGKSYTAVERKYRLAVFIKNYLEVKQINSSQKSYTVGLNKFADLTDEEAQVKYMGYRPSTEKRNYVEFSTEELAQAPTSVDWRTKGIVAAVKNQGQCGSCWAFSAVAALEGAMAQSSGSLQTFAEQQLVDCSTFYGNHGCNGGLMDNAFRYIKAKGLTTEANYPYKARDGRCDHAAVAKKVAHIHKHTDVSHNNQEHLEAAAGQHVIAVAIQANAIMKYTGGIFDDRACGTQLNHGVSVVGYGTDSGKDFWIVRNSWGADWGESGYIRMIKTDKRGAGMCGIAMQPSYPNV